MYSFLPLDLWGLAEFNSNFLDLLSQLSGGGQDQDNGSISSLQVRLVVDMDDGWEKVSQSLSWSSLSDADHVHSWEGQWPSLRLNGSWFLIVLPHDLLHDVIGNSRLVEVGDWVWDVGASDDRDFLFDPVTLDVFGVSVNQIGVWVVEVLLERHLEKYSNQIFIIQGRLCRQKKMCEMLHPFC